MRLLGSLHFFVGFLFPCFFGDFRIFELGFPWLVAPPFFDLACVLFHFILVFVVNLSISWLLLYPRFDFFLVAPVGSILLCPNACLAVIVRSSALLNDGYRCFAPLD